MNERTTQIILIFFIALVCNFLWEHVHSIYYTSYQGGSITNGILMRAAMFDAFVILFALSQIRWFRSETTGLVSMLLSLMIFAILMERFALASGRWEYQSSMIILPLINTGLSPTFQLAILGGITYFISKRLAKYFIRGR